MHGLDLPFDVKQQGLCYFGKRSILDGIEIYDDDLDAGLQATMNPC